MNQENQLAKRTFSGFLYLLSASGMQVVLKIWPASLRRKSSGLEALP
jgi:hypothetical protein